MHEEYRIQRVHAWPELARRTFENYGLSVQSSPASQGHRARGPIRDCVRVPTSRRWPRPAFLAARARPPSARARQQSTQVCVPLLHCLLRRAARRDQAANSGRTRARRPLSGVHATAEPDLG
eukprot:scaffold262475_cov35-Tisochrysis_lutea.AAC.3